jgi:hypothetical protein
MVGIKNQSHHPLTNRKDRWFLSPFLVLIGGGVAFSYLAWSALSRAYSTWGPYAAPAYAEPFFGERWRTVQIALLMIVPIGFRLTCYFGRKAFYNAALIDPPACAVGEPYRKSYTGDTKFPFIMQNLHRYFFYLACVVLLFHWADFLQLIIPREWGEWYLGVGMLLYAFDTFALTLYVGGCHSLRHFVGGGMRCACASLLRYAAWKRVSFLTRYHGLLFWASLFSLVVTDVYIRLLAMGVIPEDLHVVIG